MKGETNLSVLVVATIMIFSIGVAVSIGSVVLDTFRSTALTTQTVTNQSVTFTNYTLHSLSNSYVTSITSVANNTQTYTSGNYTLLSGIDGSQLNITISCGGNGAAASGNCTGIGATLNVSYVVNAKTTSSLSANNATQSLGNLQLPTVGTVVGAVLLIFIIGLVLFGVVGMTKGKGIGGRTE